MRDNRKIMILALSIAMTFLGVYMQFFNGREKAADKGTGKEEGEMGTEDRYDYRRRNLPDTENIPEGEAFTEGEWIEIYFENTEVLDQGSLPLPVQAGLAEYTQKYLYRNGYTDVTELYIEEESYTEDVEKIMFRCYLDGHEEMLQIEYRLDEGRLCFLIL